MAIEDLYEAVTNRLFLDDGSNVFAVLDGASVDELLPMLYKHELEFICLYRGELEPDMAEVAPYLVHLRREAKFTEWLVEKGWGNHWGLFAVSFLKLRDMRQHFRALLTVYDSQGKPLLFRYYDPRVLRVYLPTCNAEELATVFGGIEFYLLEGEDPKQALRFHRAGAVLKQETLNLHP